jgi:hypothetical protein
MGDALNTFVTEPLMIPLPADGLALGDALGLAEGLALGDALGLADGLALGDGLGLGEGEGLGLGDGLGLGLGCGDPDGMTTTFETSNVVRLMKLIAPEARLESFTDPIDVPLMKALIEGPEQSISSVNQDVVLSGTVPFVKVVQLPPTFLPK